MMITNHQAVLFLRLAEKMTVSGFSAKLYIFSAVFQLG